MDRSTRRSFLISVAAAGAARLTGKASGSRPNFLVIYTDDQGIGDLGCYGARDVKTPNMDHLAAAGVRFTDWYSNSPVCSPSRAALLTGKYPQRVGISEVLPSDATFDIAGLRQGETSLPGELRKLGYRTAAVGKWHLGSAAQSRPRAQGFDEFFGFYSGWTDGFSHRYYLGGPKQQIFHDMWHNGEEVWADPEYHTDLFARQATQHVERNGGQSPFFLYVAFGAPHFPMMSPKRYLDRFPTSMDRDRRMHAATLAAVDDGIGAILGALRKAGIERDTVIFFQSDNGATIESRADHAGRPYHGGSNAPFRGYKMGLFEGGIRMPAMMVWPGRIPAGKVVHEMGAAMDILPTFLSWARGAPPPGIDGLSMANVVQQHAPSPHDALFWAYRNQRAIRRAEWKLILNPPSFPGEEVKDKIWLSNLKEDAGESRNWIAEHPEVARDLRQRLESWAGSVGLPSARPTDRDSG